MKCVYNINPLKVFLMFSGGSEGNIKKERVNETPLAVM